jgi:hypothetical protein
MLAAAHRPPGSNSSAMEGTPRQKEASFMPHHSVPLHARTDSGALVLCEAPHYQGRDGNDYPATLKNPRWGSPRAPSGND